MASMPKKNMCSSSEPMTNYQGKYCRRSPNPDKYVSASKRSEETKLSQEYHPTDSHPVILECDGEVKKMNSEGDATGYTDISELDTIGRIAATLDEDEAEHLNDNQKKEIKNMSKFLVPRVRFFCPFTAIFRSMS